MGGSACDQPREAYETVFVTLALRGLTYANLSRDPLVIRILQKPTNEIEMKIGFSQKTYAQVFNTNLSFKHAFLCSRALCAYTRRFSMYLSLRRYPKVVHNRF